MSAFRESSEVVVLLGDVRELAWNLSQTCDSAAPHFKDLQTELSTLFVGLYGLEKKLAEPKAYLKRCDHHTEAELRGLLEECLEDIREVEGFLDRLSSQRRASRKSLEAEESELRKKICDRRKSLQDFQDRATMAALEIMKAQLYTLVDDILSKRRQPFILTQIVDWDVLADVLKVPAPMCHGMLEFDDGDAESDDDGIVELPDSPSGEATPPSVDDTRKRGPTYLKKNRYRQPTVEDYVEGEDDPLPSPVVVPVASQSSVVGRGEDILSTDAEGGRRTQKQKPDDTTDGDPLLDPRRTPTRVDTELKLMQQEKISIQDEIRKLKEEADILELQKFRKISSEFTKEEEEENLDECWRLPRDSLGRVTYFAMPNGTLYSASSVQRRIEVRPTPALRNAFGRGSTYSLGGGHGRGSIGWDTGFSSPGRRDSSFFGSSNSQHRESPALDPYSHYQVDESGAGAAAPGSRPARWIEDFAASPREMSPQPGERTPTHPRPHPQLGLESKFTPPEMGLADVVRWPLEVSLEEVFNGTHRRVTVNRKVYDQWTDSTRKELKELNVPIKRGLKAGSKIKYPGIGDQEANGVAQDIWFIVKDTPHPMFRRDSCDLHATIRLTFDEAYDGWRKTIETICGRILRVKGPKRTTNRWTKVFKDFGLPMSADPSRRGDLIVHVDIQGPDHPGVA